MYVKFNHFEYTCQYLYYLANTLANTNGLLVLDFYYLISPLINTDKMMKVDLCHLANTLTNIDDQADNFTRKRLVISNQPFMPQRQLSNI